MQLQTRIKFLAGHFVFQGMNSTKQTSLSKLIGGGIDWSPNMAILAGINKADCF